MATSHELEFLIRGRNDASPAIRDFESDVERLDTSLSRLETRDVEVDVSLRTESFDRDLSTREASLEGFDGKSASASVSLDTGRFDAGKSSVDREMADLGTKKATAEADLDTSRLVRGADLAEARIARISGQKATATADFDGTAAEANAQGFMGRMRSLFNERLSVVVDFDRSKVDAITTSFGGAAQSIRNAGTVIGAFSTVARLPALAAGLAALPALVTAAGAGLGSLAISSGSAAVGLSTVGATALAGAGGLRAYAALVKFAAEESAKGNFATTQWAQASQAFQGNLATLTGRFTEMTREIGGGVLPVMNAFVRTGIELLPLLVAPMRNLVAQVNSAGMAFLRTATQARQLSLLQTLLMQSGDAAGLLARIAGNLGLTLANVFVQALGDSNRFLVALNNLTARTQAFTASVQGQRALSDFFNAGISSAMALLRGVGNLVVAFYNIGRALNESGLTRGLAESLLAATQRFRELTAEGTSGYRMIVEFGRNALPLLRDLGNLAVAAGRGFLSMASNIASARTSGSGLTILQQLVRSVQEALPPLQRAFENTFTALGPSIARLIPELARFLESLSRAAPVVAQLIDNVTAVVRAFNSLPQSVQTGIVQIAAVATVMKVTSTAVGVLTGVFSPLLGIFRNARTEGTLLNSAFSRIGPAARAIGSAVGPAVAAIGRFAASRAVITALGVAFGALSGPIGIAVAVIATLAAGAVYAYRNFESFRRVVDTVGSAIRSGFSSAVSAVGGFLQSLPGRATSAWNSIRSGAVSAFNTLRSAASSAVQGVVGFFQALPGRVAAFFRGIPSAAASAWNTLRSGASTAVNAVIGFFQSLPARATAFLRQLAFAAGQAVGQIVNFFTGLPAKLASVWSTVQSAASTAWTWVQNAARTAFDAVVSFIASVPGRIASVWSTIQSAASTAWEWIKSAATTAFEAVVAFILSIPGRVASAWSTLQSAASAAWEWIKSAAVTAFEAVASFILSLPGRAASAWSSLQSAAGAAWSWIQSAAQTAFDAVVNFILSIPSRAVSAWEGIQSGARSSFDAVVGFFQDLPGRIGSFFIAAKDAAVDAANSLANGVLAAFTWLRDQLAAVGEYIKSNIIDPFMSGYNSVVGNSIVPDMVNEVDDWLRRVPKNAEDALRDLPERMGRHFRAAGEQAKKHLGDMPDAAKKAAGGLAAGAIVGGAALAGDAQPVQAQPVQVPQAPPQVAQQDPTRGLAEGADRSVRGMGENFERGGRDASTRLVRHLSDARDRGVKELQKLQREGGDAFDKLREGGLKGTETLTTGSVASATRMQTEGLKQFGLLREGGLKESELLQRNSNASMLAMQTENTRQALLQRDNAIKATEYMRSQNVAKMVDQQVQGTREFSTLQANGTRESALLRDNAVRATEYMRATNTTAVTNMQSEGSRQFNTLQANGTRESDTLNRNSVASMDSAQRGIVGHLTTAQQQGNQQLSTLRSSGAATMQAADPEWRNPVGNAASGVQSYLNDMLYGMQQVIEAASLNLTPPKEFQVRLTGGGGAKGFAEGGVFGGDGMGGTNLSGDEVLDMLARYGGQFSENPGLMAPRNPQLVVRGEGDSEEANIVKDRPSATQLPVLQRAADWHGMAVVPKTAAPLRYPEAPNEGIPKGRQEGFGPTMYTVIPEMLEIAEAVANMFATPWNTYENHPPGYEQPYYRERSVDWWGPGGRGDPIGEIWTSVAAEASRLLGGNLDWMLTPENDPAGHWDHVHVTAFTGTGGGGAQGMGPNIQALIAEHFPEEANFGSSVPEQVATEIGKKVRDGLTQELMKHGSGGPGTGFSGGGDVASNIALAQEMAAAMGWTGYQWEALKELWMRESGFDHLADNPGSDAFGIPQGMMGPGGHTPPSGYFTDPAVQIDWGLGYIRERHGDPASALSFHDANGSYTAGGIATKPQLATIAENGPEFFMPLNDPQSARQFVDFLDKVHEERGRLRQDHGRTRDSAEREHRDGRDSFLGGREGRERLAGERDRLARGAEAVRAGEQAGGVPPDLASKQRESAEASKQTAANTRRLAEGTPVQEQQVRLAQQTATGTNQMVNGTLLARTQNEGVQGAAKSTGSISQQIAAGAPLQSQTAGGATQTATNTGLISQQMAALPGQIAGAVGSSGGASASGGSATTGGVTAGPGQSVTNSVRNTAVDQYRDYQNTGKAQGQGAAITVGDQVVRGSGAGRHQSAISEGINQYVNAEMFSNDQDQQSSRSLGGASSPGPLATGLRAGAQGEGAEAMRREFSGLRTEVAGLKDEMRRNTEATERGHASPTRLHRDSVRELGEATDSRTKKTLGGRPAQKVIEEGFEWESRKSHAGGG